MQQTKKNNWWRWGLGAWFLLVGAGEAQLISTVTGNGNGSYLGDGFAVMAASVNKPHKISLDKDGNIYIADSDNNVIRKIDISGIITTYAGTGAAGYNGDGTATAAQLNTPKGVWVDSTGDVFIADTGNHIIRKVNISGIMSTVAGVASISGTTGDGSTATSARLTSPNGIWGTPNGDLYIADWGNHAIRKLDKANGNLTTVAGTLGSNGAAGDGGAATLASLYGPFDVFVDSTNNIYIADAQNNKIRKIDGTTGIITTVAGTGAASFSGDKGAATSATLNHPYGVRVTAGGDIVIADEANQRIRVVDGLTQIINTVAGTGTNGYNGDDIQGGKAQLWDPQGVDFDAKGNLYIADSSNNRVRKLNARVWADTLKPAAHRHNAPRDTVLAGVMSRALVAAVDTNFAVYGMQTGKKAGAHSGGNTTSLVFDPTVEFKPGEKVMAVFTDTLVSVDGVRFSLPQVWTFRTAAGVGPAVFPSLGRSLGTGSDATLDLAVGDADGDGDLDLLVGNTGGQDAVWLDGDASPSFGAESSNVGLSSGATNSVAFGDVDHDGDLDVATGDNGGQNFVHLNNGSGIFAFSDTSIVGPASSATRALAFGDVNGDGHLDLAVGNNAADDFIYLNNGLGKFAQGDTSKVGLTTATTHGMAFVDVDIDGDLDLAVAGISVQDVVYLNDGIGKYAIDDSSHFGVNASMTNHLDVGDVDADGDADIAVALEGASNVVYLNDGTGKYALADGNTFGLGSGLTEAVHFGDIDGDGDLDVWAGNRTGQNAAYINSGTGTFSTAKNFGTGSDDTRALAVADWDGDLDLDVATGNSAESNVVYLNATLYESMRSFGPVGTISLPPLGSAKFFGLGMVGNGSGSLDTLALTLSDLTTATGMAASSIDTVALYVSADSILNPAADTLLAWLPGTSIGIGTTFKLALSSPHTPVDGTESFYLVKVKVDTLVGDKHSFKVGLAAGGVHVTDGYRGVALEANDTNKVEIEVTATKLAFTTAPRDTAVVDGTDEVVSGEVFSTQPVAESQDIYGNTDKDFAETVIASISSGSGTIGGATLKTLVNGRASFAGNSLLYNATTDGEAFTLMVDDEPGGVDLTLATIVLSADVVASRLAFAREPSALVDPGSNFAVDSVFVVAQDVAGLSDTDFTAKIRLRAVSAEDTSAVVDTLHAEPADSLNASNGLGIWTSLTLPFADLFKLKATSDKLQAGLSKTVAMPGGLTVGGADSLVAKNALVNLAGKGGADLVFNAIALRAEGERMVLQSIGVTPIFSGLLGDELRNIDLIFDANADGKVDSSEQSVLASVVNDEGSGVALTLAIIDTLPADTLRHYLVVADLDQTVRATDVLRIDVTDIVVGRGLATGVPPAVPVRIVSGRDHMVTGTVDILSVSLENPRVSQTGKVTIIFDVVSDLAVGDELVIDFPLGFGVSGTTVDVATSLPSGVDPSKSGESAGQTVVLELAVAETKGRYQVVIDGLQNPATFQGAVPVVVRTRINDNSTIDDPDPAPPGLELLVAGRVELSAVELLGGVGLQGRLTVSLQTATALVAGDEIVLVFPADFGIGSATVDEASQTPSGTDPVIAAVDTIQQQMVFALQENEAAGAMSLVIDGLHLPDVAEKELFVVAHTRRENGDIVDLADEAPAGFSLSGRLQLQAGNQLTNALEGLAGSGGADVVLASFTLQAVGEDIPLLALELLPRLSGIGIGELTGIDVVLDADADGVFDIGEASVTAGAVGDGGDRVALEVVLVGQRLYADSSQSYLVVADISAIISSTDQVRIDVLGLGVGPGVISEVDPVVSGGPVFGFTHAATGNVAMNSVQLENRQTGGSGALSLIFTTASALLPGDRILLDFPSGFDLSLAQVDTSSRTPAGRVPVEEPSASTRGRFVLQLADVEDVGEYRLKLSTVINSAVAAADLAIAVASERADGTAVDNLDTDPFQFAIVAAVTSNVCRADFDGDGRVYFSDLFLFGDAFGRDGSSEFDLDGDGRVDFTDFFVFSEVFADRCDSTDIGPDDSNALALEITVDLLGGTQMEFALIRAGAFLMGSPAEEEGRLRDEGPQREVSLGESLYLGKFEVTQQQWAQVMGSSPWQGLPAAIDQGDHPAVYIAWNDAQAFVQTLNAAAGDSLYRLPSEAEWEYAARAGTSTRWSFGDDEAVLGDYAWTRRVPPVVSELLTHPVGGKRPNPWELYDMHGSAAEWVEDFYGAYGAVVETNPSGSASGTLRVLRGGGITLGAAETRSAARASFDASARLSTFGFRIVRRIARQ